MLSVRAARRGTPRSYAFRPYGRGATFSGTWAQMAVVCMLPLIGLCAMASTPFPRRGLLRLGKYVVGFVAS